MTVFDGLDGFGGLDGFDEVRRVSLLFSLCQVNGNEESMSSRPGVKLLMR
jgi:hypothetical protein